MAIYFIIAIPLRALVFWSLIKDYERNYNGNNWNNKNNLPTIAGKKIVNGKEVTMIRDTANQNLFKGILDGYKQTDT